MNELERSAAEYRRRREEQEKAAAHAAAARGGPFDDARLSQFLAVMRNHGIEPSTTVVERTVYTPPKNRWLLSQKHSLTTYTYSEGPRTWVTLAHIGHMSMRPLHGFGITTGGEIAKLRFGGRIANPEFISRKMKIAFDTDRSVIEDAAKADHGFITADVVDTRYWTSRETREQLDDWLVEASSNLMSGRGPATRKYDDSR